VSGMQIGFSGRIVRTRKVLRTLVSVETDKKRDFQ
jgi:hypothetical protein